MSAFFREIIIPLLIFLFLLIPSPPLFAAQVKLAWDPNSETNLAGYRLYYGTAPGIYDQAIDVGNQTDYLLTELEAERSYFFAVTAYNTAGHESDYSREVRWADTAGNQAPAAIIAAVTHNGQPSLLSFDAGDSTDPDGLLIDYIWRFGDGTEGRGVYVEHEFPGPGSYLVTLTVIDDQGTPAQDHLNITVPFESAPPAEFALNFQPALAPVPAGFAVDSGQLYNAAAGFGWRQIYSFKAEDRDNELSPGQEYDTLIYLDPQSVWEMAVPNGRYYLTVCMGDPTYPLGRQNLQVEGYPAVTDEALSDESRWLVRYSTVDVLDGRLTLSFEGTSRFVRLSWLKIRQLNSYLF